MPSQDAMRDLLRQSRLMLEALINGSLVDPSLQRELRDREADRELVALVSVMGLIDQLRDAEED